MKRAFVFLIFTISCLCVPAIAKRFTYGFRAIKVTTPFPIACDWEVPCTQEVREILSQKFHFLGKGAQAYAFESQDGKYVVKLFRSDPKMSEKKTRALFRACQLASNQLQNETGLIYVHLNPTSLNLPWFCCKDAVGRSYQFPLDEMRFAVQKKAEKIKETLLALRDRPDEMKKRLHQFVEMLTSRRKAGVVNTDPSLGRNFGFLVDRAVEFDFGNYADSPDAAREVDRFCEKLAKWMTKEMPEWASYLKELDNVSDPL